MGNFRQTKDFGISWGVPGFRIGKSQYGNWWISIGLPLGFRITKNLGSMKSSQHSSRRIEPQPQLTNHSQAISPQSQQLTENQKLLEKMKHPVD